MVMGSNCVDAVTGAATCGRRLIVLGPTDGIAAAAATGAVTGCIATVSFIGCNSASGCAASIAGCAAKACAADTPAALVLCVINKVGTAGSRPGHIK